MESCWLDSGQEIFKYFPKNCFHKRDVTKTVMNGLNCSELAHFYKIKQRESFFIPNQSEEKKWEFALTENMWIISGV